MAGSEIVDIALHSPSFLREGGQMGELMRAIDWSTTPLGPAHRWPHSLRAAVAIMLRSRQPMFIGWGDQLISLYNDGYIPICGSKHPAGLGRPMSELWHEIWEELSPMNERVLRGESLWFEDQPFALEGRASDDLSYFNFSYVPLLDDDGNIAGIYCSAVETTEKVRLEKQRLLRLQEQQRMFMQAPGFISTLRGSHHVFDFENEAHLRLFGGRNVLGKPFREAFPELVGQGFLELLDRVYRTGERHVARAMPMRLETGTTGNEQSLRLDFVFAPLFDEQGKVCGIFCEGQDVTDAFAAQAELREREEQLRLATDAAEVGFWDVDLVTGTLIWPPRVKAMFGISADVPVSMTDFYAGLHPDDREHTSLSFAAACEPRLRALYDVEYRTVGKEDGVVRWVAAKGRGVFDDHGRCVRVIGTAIDISARKAGEAALRDTEEKLRAADRRKDEFLATLAHELRNPLAPLRAGLHVLKARDPQEQLYEVMDRQVHYLVRLVDDLLELSRISHGTFELRKETVDLVAIARHAIETGQTLLRERNHTLELQSPAEPVWVSGDPVRLTQILSNLLNNAARYTEPGGRIVITVREQHGRGEVAVKDSGIGFGPDEAERIFAMFQRGQRSSGLGIGLALSHGLARMHGGALTGSSDGPGRGAQFTLTLNTAPQPSAAKKDAPPVAEVRNVRVLVVDDNEDAADTLQMLLRHLGAEVSVAYSGAAALEQFASLRPNVVFVDIGMPEMDGYELARRLRAQFPHETAVIVGLSGWGQAEDIRKGREAGFDHHLIKPAGSEALRAVILNVQS